MTTSQESGGASRVSRARAFLQAHIDVDQDEDRDGTRQFAWVDSGDKTYSLSGGDMIAVFAALDDARHKSEDYELRAKAAEATLARVRAYVALTPYDEWSTGYEAGVQDTHEIIDGKTK